MAAGLSQRPSHHGHAFFHSSSDAQRDDTQPGSPLAIFGWFASGLTLLLVVGTAIGLVAHLAHLINTGWRFW
jgi:hypothetical protein